MSLCGFACCHCGRCGDSPAARYGLKKIKGQCPECGTFNGPHDEVCKKCGAKLDLSDTEAPRPNSAMSNPSLLRKGR